MHLFSANLFLSSSVSPLFLISSWMFFSGFTEMTIKKKKKTALFCIKYQEHCRKNGIEEKQLSCSIVLFQMNGASRAFVDFYNIETVRHIIGPWNRILTPPIAYSTSCMKRAQCGNFSEWCRMCEYQNSPTLL